MLLQAGVVAGLPYLKRLTASGKRARPEALAVAERMVKAWSADSQPWDSYVVGGGQPGPTHRIEMLASLRKLNAAVLLERFVKVAAGNPASLATWRTMGECERAFAAQREAVGEVQWREMLDRYGWKSFADIRKALDAIRPDVKEQVAQCYSHLDAIARKAVD